MAGLDLVAKLRLNDISFSKGMANANRSMGMLKNSSIAVAAQLGMVTTAAAGVAAAFVGVGKAMDFESQMSSIKALTGATSSEMKQMSDLALEMGKSTKYSALEAGAGIEELLKAGLTPAAVQAGGLESALNLATAGGLELADAAEIMSTALNAYKSDGITAAQASNILAGTANASATGVMDLRYSLAAVSAVASGVGMSFKDTNTALGLFANNGLKGSDAGTSLKTMLSNLQPTTDAQVDLFRELGLMTKEGANQFFTAEGRLKSLDQISGLLSSSMKDLTNQQRMMAMETMFGSDAIRAGNILFKEGAEGVKKFQSEMSKVTALDVAKEKMNNAAGAVEQFKGALETLQISVLTPLLPVIKDGANALSEWIANLKPETIKSWGESIKSVVQTAISFSKAIYDNREVVLAFIGAMAVLKAGFVAMSIVSTINGMMKAYRTAVVGATTAQAFFNGVLFANPIGLVIGLLAALTAAGVYLYRNFDTVAAKMDGAWQWIKNSAATAMNFVIGKINEMIGLINKIPGVNVPIVPKIDITPLRTVKITKKDTSKSMNDARAGLYSGHSHHGGLSRVPYDGYAANLHKNEQVLTAQEAQAYRNGGKGGKVEISFAGANFHVRQESDIDAIAKALAKQMSLATGGV